MANDTFGSRSTLRVGDAQYAIHRLDALTRASVGRWAFIEVHDPWNAETAIRKELLAIIVSVP